MGRNKKKNHDPMQQLLKGFKEEIKQQREQQVEIVENLKNEITRLRRIYPKSINKKFERALKKLQQEEAKKNRSIFFSIFKCLRKSNNENISWSSELSVSDSNEEDEDDYQHQKNNKGKALPKPTIRDAINGKPQIGLQREALQQKKYVRVNVPTLNDGNMNEQATMVLSSTSLEELALREYLLNDPEFIAATKNWKRRRIEEDDSDIEKCTVELSKKDLEFFVDNMPIIPICDHAVLEEVNRKGVRHNKKKKEN